MLVLDVLRVLSSSPQAAAAYTHRCSTDLETAAAAAAQLVQGGRPAGLALGRACVLLRGGLPSVEADLLAAVAGGAGSAAVQVGGRALSFDMARLFTGGEMQGCSPCNKAVTCTSRPASYQSWDAHPQLF